jgi:hypothetical protein
LDFSCHAYYNRLTYPILYRDANRHRNGYSNHHRVSLPDDYGNRDPNTNRNRDSQHNGLHEFACNGLTYGGNHCDSYVNKESCYGYTEPNTIHDRNTNHQSYSDALIISRSLSYKHSDRLYNADTNRVPDLQCLCDSPRYAHIF